MTSTEAGTGSFPTMGTSAAQLANTGRPERGRLRPKAGPTGGNTDGPTGHRRASFEKMGATLHPTATLYAQNAAEASDTERRVVTMPSRGSWTDNVRGAAKRACM